MQVGTDGEWRSEWPGWKERRDANDRHWVVGLTGAVKLNLNDTGPAHRLESLSTSLII